MTNLKKPVLTEKTMKEYKDNSVVRFEVPINTDKVSASKALEQIFGVKVISSRVLNRLGKFGQNRFNKRSRQLIKKKKDTKIVIFKLEKGNKLDIFEESSK